MAAGMRFGYKRALWNILGLQLGILFVLVVVAAGLGAVLAASATGFTAVKWLGVAYLVWLGIQQWRAPVISIDVGAALALADSTPKALLLRGFLVNATNPKGILFMLAVLPQFIDPARPQLVQFASAASRCSSLISPDERVHGPRGAHAAPLARAASSACAEPDVRRIVHRCRSLSGNVSSHRLTNGHDHRLFPACRAARAPRLPAGGTAGAQVAGFATDEACRH
jgi:hypothetical protein